jgi:1-deoxy-D-xylulose-5-phosphate synthase
MSKAESPSRVVAVIGDGSLSNGLPFEGLYFAGMRKQHLIVVLTANTKFISKRGGAVADYLGRTMTSRGPGTSARGVKQRSSASRSSATRSTGRPKLIEGNLKSAVTEGLLFEEMGFRYVGPIDGHNMAHLVEAFQNVAAWDEPPPPCHHPEGPRLPSAVRDPEHYHGVGKFDWRNGNSIKGAAATETTYSTFSAGPSSSSPAGTPASSP